MAGEVSKKILWIFVFLILAAIAILGVLFIRGYQSGKEVTAVEVTPEPTLAEDETSALLVTLLEPSSDIATASARLTINGTTAPEAIVAIGGIPEDMIVVADNQGRFQTTITLAEGINTLTIQAYNDSGDASTTKRTIVYTKGAL